MPHDLVVHCRYLLSPTADSWLEKENQILCIDRGAITAIEDAPKNWKAKFKSKKYVDLPHHLVLPGLVNAHTHLSMTLFRGLAEDMNFHQWLNDYILPVEKQILDRDFVRVGAELAAWECLSQGVTCVNDMYYFTDVVLDVLDKAGLRGFVGQTFMSFPTPDNKKQDGSDYKILKRNITKYKHNPRLKPAAAPHAPYTCDDDLLKAVRAFANDHGIPLHIHVSETAEEVEESKRTHGGSPVERLSKLGIFNGPTSIAHGVHLSAEDRKLLKRHACGVVHNPESNMKIKAGVCEVDLLLKDGIVLGLGTDGAASNNNLSLVQEMGTGIKLQKLMDRAVTARDFFRMATLGGAACLGLDGLVGSIEVGKRADLVALDLDLPHMMPLHDPLAQVVYSAGGSEVSHVICDGKILLENGKYKTLNVARIQKDVLRHRDRIQRFLKKRGL
jgi:5-methylthioadenosine/S-adenosylhomocysteine deaminase